MTTETSGLLADRYELGPLLGSGGVGLVHQAFDRLLERQVAVKVLRPDCVIEHADRIAEEAIIAAGIDDPRVVTVLDTGMSPGGPYLVMEAFDGTTVADLLTAGSLSDAQWGRLADDLLRGLSAAHAVGVLHRDIKPSNILCAGEGFCITDFGASSMSERSTSFVPMGTPSYAAPETLRGGDASVRSDVYSAAAVLHRGLVGAASDGATVPSHPRPLPDGSGLVPLPERVPAHIRQALEAALSEDPERRPASAEGLRCRLEAVDQDRTVPLPSGPRDTDPTVPLLDAGIESPAATDRRPSASRATGIVVPWPHSARSAATAAAIRDGVTRLQERVGPIRNGVASATTQASDRLRRSQRWAAAIAVVIALVLLTVLLRVTDSPGGAPEVSPVDPAPPAGESDQRADLARTLDAIEELGR